MALIWATGCSDAVRQTRSGMDLLLASFGHQAPDEDRPGPAEPVEGTSRASPADAQGTLATQEMSDEALGRLILELSEDTGDFPSDNFVSNETSYLHVAPELLDPELRGRAYVGVGPEQNLSYITMMKTRVAYIVDIRRQNMLQHLVFRAMIEPSETRESFLRKLTSRSLPEGAGAMPAEAPIEEICDRLAKVRPDPAAVEAGEEATVALMERLGLPEKADDRQAIRNVLKAFATEGVDLTYSMEKSRRRYPKLRELLSARDDEGEQRGFLASESGYGQLRDMLKANRVVPVVGDFLGDKALEGAGDDMRRRGLKLGVFYTSNVEQYLWPQKSYQRFIDNVKSFPADGSSRVLRVWFDQGKTHPSQRKGHRTTSLIVPLGAFLERWEKRPYRGYWEVATDRLGQE
jgi:hypothetical protein